MKQKKYSYRIIVKIVGKNESSQPPRLKVLANINCITRKLIKKKVPLNLKGKLQTEKTETKARKTTKFELLLGISLLFVALPITLILTASHCHPPAKESLRKSNKICFTYFLTIHVIDDIILFLYNVI